MKLIPDFILCAFFAYGMFTIQRPGFLLDFLRPLWKSFPKGLHEPLFECGVCTASIWGGLCFVYLNLMPSVWYWYLPVVIVAASGLQAVLDRGVKGNEKIYGYNPASKDPSKEWDYLVPYVGMRTMLLEQFVNNTRRSGNVLVEIGGYHQEWEDINYVSLQNKSFGKEYYNSNLRHQPYSLVIMGLAFEGDLRLLREAIINSKMTLIEYSDDGISRQQVDLLTEGIRTRMIVPEYFIDVQDAPEKCGTTASKRKLIIVQPV